MEKDAVVRPNKKTLAEQAYEILYTDIVSGKYRPREELTEVQLAEQLQISRTPVREALKRLKDMGLLVGNNYSRMNVKVTTREEVEEVMDIRTMLEIYTIEAAIDCCKQEDIQALERILERTKAALERDATEEVISCNSQFHEYLYQISGKEVTIQLLNSLRTRLSHYRVMGRSSGMHWRNYEGHVRIVEHIRNKDKERLVAEILKHTLESKESILAGLVKDERNSQSTGS